VNNAGILDAKPMLDFDIEAIETGMDTNFIGPIRMTKALFPLLEKSKDARIINISSIMAAKDELLGGSAAYRLSKWSLNGFTVLLANELRNSHIKVFAVHPGWVMTDMGGAGATKTVAQGADTPVWLATAPDDDLMNGWFYAERKKIQY
jgi:NAD(P)-dependent dehydrogenase (short-subunit alcohol dehydrogenase family)